MSWPYNTAENPPIPVCTARIWQPLSGTWSGELDFVIDSGADCTCIPDTWVEKYLEGSIIYEVVPTVSFDGSEKRMKAYRILVHPNGDLRPHEVRALVLSDDNPAILGRDVINKWHLVLNGPKQESHRA